MMAGLLQMGLCSIIKLVQLLDSTKGASNISHREFSQKSYNSYLFTFQNQPITRVLCKPVSYQYVMSSVQGLDSGWAGMWVKDRLGSGDLLSRMNVHVLGVKRG